jgi:hypothetical protein
VYAEEHDYSFAWIYTGKIDAISRMKDGETLDSDRIRKVCPPLKNSLEFERYTTITTVVQAV